MSTEIENLSKEFKEQLIALYGQRFDKLILFGSYARGDFHEDSDVDFMVVLNDEVIKGSTEIAFLRRVISNLSIEHNRFVSILPTNKNRYQESTLPFYNEVRKDSIEI